MVYSLMISERGRRLIQHFEGFRALPYICAGGVHTVGFGHVLTSQEGLTFPIDRAEAEHLFAQDLATVERALMRLVCVPLTTYQWDALCSFVFNVGSGAFQRSRLRRCVNREAHEEVSEHFMKWVWAGGRPHSGLRRRRQAEADLYDNVSSSLF